MNTRPALSTQKSYVADDKLGVVGTINMDYRSLYLHFECGTLMYDSPAVIDLRNDDLATIEKSRKIELSDSARVSSASLLTVY